MLYSSRIQLITVIKSLNSDGETKTFRWKISRCHARLAIAIVSLITNRRIALRSTTCHSARSSKVAAIKVPCDRQETIGEESKRGGRSDHDEKGKIATMIKRMKKRFAKRSRLSLRPKKFRGGKEQGVARGDGGAR